MVDLQKSETALQIDTVTLKKSALVIRAVNHKLRNVILQLLHQKEKLSVTDVYQTLRLEQSVASQHLAILRRAGIVKATRNGKYIYYEVNYERLREVQHIVGLLLRAPSGKNTHDLKPSLPLK